jgi:hypothetical protein
MDLQISVFTGDSTQKHTPKGAIGKYFIPLGSDHNYGKCYELVCWINDTSDCFDCSIVNNPYLSLMYSFEFKDCKLSHKVDFCKAMSQLKVAIKLLPDTICNSSLHRDYMMISASRCLDEHLTEYSFSKYHECMVKKIQNKWLYHYYNPTSSICKRIKMRQFEKLNSELLDYVSHKQDILLNDNVNEEGVIDNNTCT